MPRFGDLEAAIMDQVWALGGGVRVRDVLEELERSPVPAYTTVQTVMEILFRKGWLTRRKHGRVNLYTAAASREDYVARLMGEALAEAQDRPAVLVRLVEEMDPAESAELRALLEAARSHVLDPDVEGAP